MTQSNKTWRVAFIGAGFVVQRSHIPNFQRLPNVEMVGVCDVNEKRAQQVAAEAGIPHAFADHQKMLAELKPDLTIIATPNVFHKPMTLAALDAGSHVLCEKPLALTYEDAKHMVETAQDKGLTLTVGTHYRWSEPMQICKAHVDAGFFGDIYAVRTVWSRRAGIPGFGSWFTNLDLAGGGSLLDIGVHALDRALFLMDYPEPVTVSGATFSKFGTRGQGLGRWGIDIQQTVAGARFDVDDLAWAFVRFANGAALQLQVAWATHHPEEFITQVYGTEGGAAIGNSDNVELYTTLNGQQVKIEPEIPSSPLSSYARQADNLVRYLDGDPAATIVTPRQTLISAQIVDGVLRSAAQNTEIALEA